ncbi:MAG: ATP synthase F1 subunit delta [Polyangiales bacterium]|nr:ATP synthase F1 subunit delta [Myxococcales bacterium]
MSASTLGRRYGRAVLALAQESGELDKVKTDFDGVLASWNGSSELQNVFENPKVGPEARRSVIDALAGRMGLSGIVVRTLKLLSDRRRMRALPEVIEAFRILAEETAGQLRAEVKTAKPMPDAYYTELGRVLERIVGRKIVVVPSVDPSLLGGVVARVGDRVFDGSVKNRLTELKESLLLN